MSIELVEPMDLLDPEQSADPHPYYARLRESDPVHYNEYQRAWLIARYSDVGDAYLDPVLSSDRVRPLLNRLDGKPKTAMAPMLEVMSRWMVVTDPPSHTRLRQLANTAFKQQRVAAMREWIAELVDGLLDDFIASGSTDFLGKVAYVMPATVIATMMGAPASDAALFQHWSDELALVAFGTGGDDRADRHERALAGVTEMQKYITGLIEKARAEPGSDMISALLSTATKDGDHLSDDELVALCTLLLFAGHETTTNLLCNAVVTLTAHPEQLAALRAEPSLINGAVEEALRFEGPIKTIQRWVLADHERGGRTLRAGERVFLMNSAANRDPSHFADADAFDIRRPTKPLHVAFGRGVHSCLGAQLARLEARTAIPRFLDRLPGLRLAEPVEFKPSIASRSVRALHVDYDGRSV